jgi:hypothetical protein
LTTEGTENTEKLERRYAPFINLRVLRDLRGEPFTEPKGSGFAAD